MISSGRYEYHLQDIAEIEAKSGPRNHVDTARLSQMKQEVAAFERASPDEAAKIQARLKEHAKS